MPFDEEPEDQPSLQSKKVGIKNVSSQKSIFDSIPKKPSQEEFSKQVKEVQDRMISYKSKTADLAMQFNKAMADKTLVVNKNIIQKEMELDVLKSMIKLAQEINSDPNEREGEGSLSWITLLLRTCFFQRDKINNLEYAVSQLQKKTDPVAITDLINKALDSRKKSE